MSEHQDFPQPTHHTVMCACLQVWASKWNDRAWLSRKARGVADSDLFMACLLQQVCLDLAAVSTAAAVAVFGTERWTTGHVSDTVSSMGHWFSPFWLWCRCRHPRN